MCLSKILNEELPQGEVEAWKVFIIYPGRVILYPEIQSGVYQLGWWYKAPEKKILIRAEWGSIGGSIDGEEYESGFHGFLTEDDAVKWRSRYSWKIISPYMKVVKVKFRGISCIGEQGMLYSSIDLEPELVRMKRLSLKVYVAKEMFIPEDAIIKE